MSDAAESSVSMNISYKWLKEYVDTTLSPEEVAAALTSTGLETDGVEHVEAVRGGFAGIVIGKILTCVPHPDSDHLHVTTVDLGLADGPAQIVCGAPNVAAGQTVVVATIGTTLYAPDGQSFKIKKSKIRGVESYGMICAEDEVGLGSLHDGIMVLGSDAESMVGHPAAEYFKHDDDYIIEVDLTPNRIDAASHYGVARDLAAWLSCRGTPVKAVRPSDAAFKVDDPATPGVSVDVRDSAGCIRYCGVTIRGVKVAESPDWLKKHLSAIGMHPINNIVDITNYILHAYGQPLHAFDEATLEGDRIVVRRADAGAKFTTLDGVERTLDAADLMICDATKARCMAGVFGGLASGVTDTTTNVFIESACFNSTSVRRTARRHGISTDSSFRFERGVDPNGCMYALHMAALLIKECAGGEIVGSVADVYPTEIKPVQVDMRFSDFGRLIGCELPRATVDTILDSLDCAVTEDGEMMHISVPTYRVDVTRPCDIIEEVLRIYGYNNVPIADSLHACLSFKTPIDAADDLRRTICEQLTGAGYNEILNNSLTASSYYAGNSVYPEEACVHLLNPLSRELNVLRQTLLYGGLETIAHNSNRRNADLALYEFGNVYRCDPTKEYSTDKPLAAYSEGMKLGLWLCGDMRSANWLRQAEQSTAYDIKAAVQNVLARCGVSAQLKEAAPDALLCDRFEVVVAKGGVTIGCGGVVDAAVTHTFGIKTPVFFAELDWQRIAAMAAAHNVVFAPIPKTQAVRRDLSLLLDDNVTMAALEAAIRKCEPRLLRSVELFDVYEGDNLPAGKKSYAIAITMRDDEKTLQDKYIDKVMAKITDTVKRSFGAELR